MSKPVDEVNVFELDSGAGSPNQSGPLSDDNFELSRLGKKSVLMVIRKTATLQLAQTDGAQRNFGFFSTLGVQLHCSFIFVARNCLKTCHWIVRRVKYARFMTHTPSTLKRKKKKLANARIRGGPVGFVYRFLFVWLGTLATFLTKGELASI